MTVKDLSSEVDQLKQMIVEKDDLIKALDEKIFGLQTWVQELYTNLCNKINESDKLHVSNAKILDNKITALEELIGKANERKKEDAENIYENKGKSLKLKVTCREGHKEFEKKDGLKKHILEAHPRIINCDECNETFDQNWKLEQHMNNKHCEEKKFKCNICGKSFVLEWRLKKHIIGHGQENVKF